MAALCSLVPAAGDAQTIAQGAILPLGMDVPPTRTALYSPPPPQPPAPIGLHFTFVRQNSLLGDIFQAGVTTAVQIGPGLLTLADSRRLAKDEPPISPPTPMLFDRRRGKPIRINVLAAASSFGPGF